jgi:hypothetical protein
MRKLRPVSLWIFELSHNKATDEFYVEDFPPKAIFNTHSARQESPTAHGRCHNASACLRVTFSRPALPLNDEIVV